MSIFERRQPNGPYAAPFFLAQAPYSFTKQLARKQNSSNLRPHIVNFTINPADKYMFKINNRNTRIR